jgi:hypothetical protein
MSTNIMTLELFRGHDHGIDYIDQKMNIWKLNTSLCGQGMMVENIIDLK